MLSEGLTLALDESVLLIYDPEIFKKNNVFDVLYNRLEHWLRRYNTAMSLEIAVYGLSEFSNIYLLYCRWPCNFGYVNRLV